MSTETTDQPEPKPVGTVTLNHVWGLPRRQDGEGWMHDQTRVLLNLWADGTVTWEEVYQ